MKNLPTPQHTFFCNAQQAEDSCETRPSFLCGGTSNNFITLYSCLARYFSSSSWCSSFPYTFPSLRIPTALTIALVIQLWSSLLAMKSVTLATAIFWESLPKRVVPMDSTIFWSKRTKLPIALAFPSWLCGMKRMYAKHQFLGKVPAWNTSATVMEVGQLCLLWLCHCWLYGVTCSSQQSSDCALTSTTLRYNN